MTFQAPDSSSVHGTGASIVTTILSYIFGWVEIATITDALVIGIISMLIGFYGPKLLNWLHGDNKKKKKDK